MISKSTNKNKGFTLLEVIAAIFVLTVGVLGAYSVVSRVLSTTHSSANRLTAAYLAKEGIEIVRNIRDTNWLEGAGNSWDEGLTGCSGGCEADYTTPNIADPTLTSYSDGRFLYIDKDDMDGDGITNFYRYINSPGPNDIKTNFKRKVTITPVDEPPPDGVIDYLEVKVEVWWEEKGETKGPIRVMENLYNWGD